MAQKGEVESRPWSRYSKGSSAYTRSHPNEKTSKSKKERTEAEDADMDEETRKELAENKKKKGNERIA